MEQNKSNLPNLDFMKKVKDFGSKAFETIKAFFKKL